MSLRLLLVLGVALPLAACSNDTPDRTTDVTVTQPDVMTTPDPMMTDPAMTDPAMAGDSEVTVDGTIAAAGSDLTALPADAAVRNINGWIMRLQGANFPGAQGIVADLETLRGHLQASPIDGSAVGATLVRLGDATTASAAGAATSSQEGLRTLGGALTSTGQRLTGGM